MGNTIEPGRVLQQVINQSPSFERLFNRFNGNFNDPGDTNPANNAGSFDIVSGRTGILGAVQNLFYAGSQTFYQTDNAGEVIKLSPMEGINLVGDDNIPDEVKVFFGGDGEQYTVQVKDGDTGQIHHFDQISPGASVESHYIFGLN